MAREALQRRINDAAAFGKKHGGGIGGRPSCLKARGEINGEIRVYDYPGFVVPALAKRR